MTREVLSIDAPAITSHQYALVGRVKYENVESDGYLEMWSHFGERGAFFSRTLADAGPMKKLSGSSDWRLFRLPFTSNGQMPPPERLVVNVVLPARGVVTLSPLTLVQGGGSAWWSERQAGAWGGLLGGALGILGGLVGGLASKRKGRTWVMFTLHSMIGLGVLGLIAGGIAVLRSQPYHVYFPE
jgi:hypothetical protein